VAKHILSDPQLDALKKLHPDYFRSAYDIQHRLSTLQALVRRGLVKKRGCGTGQGSAPFPRTAFTFVLTSEGAKVVEELG